MTTARRRAVGAHTAGVFLAATLLALSLNLSPVLTAAAAAPTATTSDQAVAYQTTITHSSGPVHDTLAPPLMRIWSTQFSGGVSYPLIANGRVFVTAVDATTRHPFLYALKQASGVALWGPVDLGGNLWANAAYDSGRVFTVNFTGLMDAFDEASGTLLWSLQLPNQRIFTSPPTAANGLVYTGGAGNGGTLYAVKEADGSLVWSSPVINGDMSAPAVSTGGVYVTYACGQAFDFNPQTGAQIWHHDSYSCGGGKMPVLSNGRLWVRDPLYGNLAIDAQSGVVLGGFTAIPAPAFDGTRGFFLSGSTLTATNVSTNASLWSFGGDGALSTAPVVVNGYVYEGSTSGNLYALAAESGAQVWSANVGSAINAPDEQNASQPLTGLGAGGGLLLVSAGSTLNAYVGQETLSPGDASYADQPVRTISPAMPITLTNNGSSPLKISGITTMGDFGQTNACGTSLASGASCVINVTFAPTLVGSRAGSLTITDSAPGSPHQIPLNGTGSNNGARLVLTPSTATIAAGASQSYQAEAFDSLGNDLGNVTSATRFYVDSDLSAPCTANVCTVIAAGTHQVIAEDGALNGTADLTVTAGAIDHISISPPSATIGPDLTVVYSSQATDAYGNGLGDVTATSTFAISPDGLCIGSSCFSTVSGPHTVTATYQGKTATAALTIGLGNPTFLSLSPANASIAIGGRQTYTAEGLDQYRNSFGDVTAATTFTIDAAACTANVCTSSQVGTHIVSGQWRGVTATASLSVRPDAPSKLTAVANGKKVNLSWAGGSTDKTYRVYRSFGGGSMVMIASGLTATSFSDSTVVSGVTYSYYVTGVSAMGVESLPSNTVSVALN